ncbi:MAG TPA: YceI family protein [Gemmatimonadaceae bacterium]|jgi:polyisoprenoid-binding protein YceI|nr:YceI family protein [Gemmatimonadaceae bacterium]
MSNQSIRRASMIVGVSATIVVACTSGNSETAYARAVDTTVTAQSTTAARPASKAALRYVLAPSGNAARYRVREQLMGHDFPNDAVGETKSLTGAIAFDASGKVIRDESKFTLDAGTFVSDQNRRDGYVRGRLLESDDYPTITFVPTEVSGVKLPVATSGSAQIQMLGDLTVHGVTRPTTWNGTVQFNNAGLTGNASTAFTFEDIQLDQPRVPVLLSVADTIKLEINFNLVRQ